MKNILTIRYFALLREQAGAASETLEAETMDLASIYKTLSRKYNFTLDIAYIKAAVNGEFCGMDFTPRDGDEIVFIPPVAGG